MDHPDFAIVLLFGSFLLLILLRTPVAFALAISAMATALYTGTSPEGVVRKLAQELGSWSLLAIPFFILAGEIMSAGSISRRLIDLATAVVGRVRGGLAAVNILASMFFGGISGSSVADTSSIGAILIPSMKRRGYDAEYAVAVTVSSSTQGIIIPPSHNAIIFGFAFGYMYIEELFVAGILPGILVGVALMAVAQVLAVRRGYPREPAVSPVQFARIFVGAVPALLTAVIIVGGILTGWFTAVESAVVAAVYALLLSTLGYRDLPWRKVPPLLVRSVRTIGMVMFLIASAGAFAWMMTRLGVPDRLTRALLGVTTQPVLMLLIILGLLLLLGCLMDMAPLILITAPILRPSVVEVIGMHPAHFGIVMLLALGVGLITPPVGSTLFVGCTIGGTTIERTTRVLWPFYLAMLATLLLIAFVPPLALWLPSLLAGPAAAGP